MYFGTIRNLQSGGLYEQDGVVYVNGQGYDLTTLAIIPGKLLGCFDTQTSQYTASICRPAHPMLLSRFMTEARGLYISGENTTPTTEDNHPTTMDNAVSGYGAFGNAMAYSDGTMPVALHTGYDYQNIVKFGADPSDTRVIFEGVAGAVTGASGGSRHAAAVPGSKYPLQIHNRLGITAGSQNNLYVLRSENPAPVFNSGTYGPNGMVFDAQPGFVGIFSQDVAAAFSINVNRYTVPNLVMTNIATSPTINGGGDKTAAAIAASPAVLINGRRRAYALQLKLTGSLTTLLSVCVDYTDLSSLTSSNMITNTIALNGITPDKCTPQTSAQLYPIIGGDGVLYLVAFICDFSQGGLGQTMVFKETAVGQLQLLSYNKDTVPDSMRNILCTKNDNKEWMLMTAKGVDTWRWNDATKKPERQATIGGLAPAAAGIDSMGRTWVVERPANPSGSANFKVHVFPPEGVVSFTRCVWDSPNGVDYLTTNVMTNVNVDALDRAGNRVAANLNLTLSGPATFADGSISKVVATNTTAATVVPVIVTGPGMVGVLGAL